MKVTCDHWKFVGEDTGGFIYLCTRCGATKNEDGEILSDPVSNIDTAKLTCPELGFGD